MGNIFIGENVLGVTPPHPYATALVQFSTSLPAFAFYFFKNAGGPNMDLLSSHLV